MMSLKVSDLTGKPEDVFFKPQIIGNYSIDGERRYCNDMSQLKYYKQPPNPEDVNFNLDDNYSQTIYRSKDTNPKLDFMLKWISENFDLLRMQNLENSTGRWLEAEIICYRGLLINLFLTTYNENDGWIICASKLKGTIYLCVFETDEQKRQKLRRNAYQTKCYAWGQKFEQYLLSDTPSADPNLTIPLNQNEEFCCTFKSQLGKTSLLYGAEIDGVCSKQEIQNVFVEKEIEFIELKTIHYRYINRKGHIDHRKAFATLKWWCQSYLVGIKRIITGCKDNSGAVIKIKEFKCSELLNYSKNLFSLEVCKSFCNEFLERIKTIVREDYNKYLYKFTYNPETKDIKVDIIKHDPLSEYTFLHSWYITKLNQHFEE